MNRFELLLKGGIAGIGAYMGNVFGPMSPMLTALVFLAVIDYVSGVCAAIYQGKLSSSAGFKGIIKKVIIFCIVAAAHSLDLLFGGEAIRSAAIFFYISNELISIIENAGKMNIPLPRAFTKAIAVLKDREKNEN
ncbi:prophage LambdaBa02, holin [Fictibacillus macauensis ZFHKF-1]|uniref:Prophage LambdaBa02, holin n=1 Tax=Fictibacillus macauensis ZFHKF-1 TaxID=1196324 RepID=I8UHE7_9BACL|nr:phage holin family protein [Fictibacillus macauensis]EIT86335.1 prophage LambdaBa02, holin [Fictibacillus macauensis ZFHKF-1]